MIKGIKWLQLWQLIRSMTLATVREPAVLFWGIIFPILMSLGLGIAFSKKTDTVRRVAMIDNSCASIISDTAAFPVRGFEKIVSRGASKDGKEKYWTLTIKNNKTGNQTFHFMKTEMKEAIVWLKRGDVNLILEIDSGRPVYQFDPANSDARLSYLMLSGIFETGKIVNIENTDSIVPMTVSGTRYIDFLIPGLIAMGIMSSCLWGISYSIIEKRSKKLLRRMVATPMKKSYFLVAIITVRTAMNVVEGVLLYIFAFLVFNFRLEGSLLALLIIFFAGNFAFAGISVLISSRTDKSEIGNGLINVVSMPMMALSGIFFSYHNFPDWSIPFIRALPLTMMADSLRSVFIEGAGIVQVFIPSLILALTGIVCFSVGLKVFKWH